MWKSSVRTEPKRLMSSLSSRSLYSLETLSLLFLLTPSLLTNYKPSATFFPFGATGQHMSLIVTMETWSLVLAWLG